jgi:hypothetical protein
VGARCRSQKEKKCTKPEQTCEGKLPTTDTELNRSRARSGVTLVEATRTTQSPKQRLHDTPISRRNDTNTITTHVKTPPFRTRGSCGRYGHLSAKPLHLIRLETCSPRDKRPRWRIVVAVVDRLLMHAGHQSGIVGPMKEFTNHEHLVCRYGGYFSRWCWLKERLGGALGVGMVGFMVGDVRCRKARWGTSVGVGVLNVSVRICVCGRVRLGSHDPCEGREWWVEGDRRTWAAAVEVCIGHVKEV